MAEKRAAVGEAKAPSRVARMLALAHHVERLIEAGELSGHAEAARCLGLTRARLTQVMNLLLLAPKIQERILIGGLRASERSLRAHVKEPAWERQVAVGSLRRNRRAPEERSLAPSEAARSAGTDVGRELEFATRPARCQVGASAASGRRATEGGTT